MKTKSLRQIYDGDWFQPTMKKHMMACCDCGLVHRLNFRIVEDAVQIQSTRAPRYTAALRQNKLKVKK